MFELRIQEPKVANNPTVAVRWCLGSQERNWLLEKKIEQPYVLIVVCYERGYGYDAYLEPIDKLMTYISLRYPGRHQLLALIVWPQISDTNKRSGRFMRSMAVASWKSYILQLTWYRDIQRDYDETTYYFWAQGELGKDSPFWESPKCSSTVAVAKEYFAPVQRNWVWSWVNLWYDTRPKDQCQYRKRMIFAFALQPFVECLLMILRELFWVLVFLLGWGILGWRDLRPKVLLAPWRYGFTDVFADEQKSWWVEDSNGRKKSRFVMFSHPLALCAYWYAFHSLSQHLGLGYWETAVGLPKKFGMIIWLALTYQPVQIGLLAVAAVLFAVYLVHRSVVKGADGNDPGYQTRLQRAREQEEERKRLAEEKIALYYDKLYKSAACVSVPKSPTLQTLAPKQRTFRLRFLDMKAKVCKPFAG